MEGAFLGLLLPLVFALLWVSTTVSGQGHDDSLEVLPGNLVYYNEEITGVDKPIATFKVENPPSALEPRHKHGRHYLKGSSERTNSKKETESDADLELDLTSSRQSSRCRGVCSYIPDRDFCPTYIPEDAFEDDYSEENSIEDSEEYDDDDDDLRRTEPNRSKNNDKNSTREEIGGYEYSQKGESESKQGFHVVYPSLTRHAHSRRTREIIPPPEKDKKRNKAEARRGRRERRPPVKFRQSALEQEIVIRWDRVVERGPYIGGDIVLPEGVLLRPPNFQFMKRRWPRGVIPFTVDPQLNECRTDAIFDSMDEIEERTCIRFVERKRERDYLSIQRANIGCSSYVGMIGGTQHLNLSTGCFSKFTVTHELMHAIGFDHEQSRKDRDKFIDIDFGNVLKQKQGQFELNPRFSGSGFPYDIRSIMHYSAFLFAKDKCEPTIYPVDGKVDICDLGSGNKRGGMTNCDAAKINKLYKCGRKYSKKCKIQK